MLDQYVIHFYQTSPAVFNHIDQSIVSHKRHEMKYVANANKRTFDSDTPKVKPSQRMVLLHWLALSRQRYNRRGTSFATAISLGLWSKDNWNNGAHIQRKTGHAVSRRQLQRFSFKSTSRLTIKDVEIPEDTLQILRSTTKANHSVLNPRWPSPPSFPKFEKNVTLVKAINETGSIPMDDDVDTSGKRVNKYVEFAASAQELISVRRIFSSKKWIKTQWQNFPADFNNADYLVRRKSIMSKMNRERMGILYREFSLIVGFC